MSKRKGNVWKYGDNVDTDQIIPAEFLTTGDPKELAKHAFEKYRPEFAKEVKKGDVIIANENFGCGSSREHAPRSLMGAGVKCVLAKSFSSIFYRSAINLGLPVLKYSEDLNIDEVDEVKVDIDKNKVFNITKKEEHNLEPIPDFLKNLLRSGGLVKYTSKELTKFLV